MSSLFYTQGTPLTLFVSFPLTPNTCIIKHSQDSGVAYKNGNYRKEDDDWIGEDPLQKIFRNVIARDVPSLPFEQGTFDQTH